MSDGKDWIREFADGLRAKDGVEARHGVCLAQRVEIVRGKDLARWVKEHQEECLRFNKGPKGTETPAKDVVEALMRRGLLRRCERQFKKPPPGSKKLVKFPKKLVPPQPADAAVFSEEAFYLWTYERPTSPWTYVIAVLGVLGMLMACLFPLAPYPVKAAVFYVAATLLAVILGILTLRLVLASISWVVSGHTVWLLPNILSDDVPIKQLFRPVYAVEKPPEDKSLLVMLAARISVGVGLATLFYVLYAHTPESGAVIKEASRYRDELFDLFNIRQADYGQITNTSTPINATEAGMGEST